MTDPEFKKTPFYDMHVALGAQMGPFGGYIMPISYKGIVHEHHACRKGAVLFDTCHMGEFLLKGTQASGDLERVVSCDVASMKAGQCRYGLMCNERGCVIDDLVIYRFGADEFMLVVNAGTQDNDFAWVVSHKSAGTVAENISAGTAKFDLQGPGSAKIVARLMDEPVTDMKFYQFKYNSWRGKRVLVSRTGYTGEMGFEFYAEPDLASALWTECARLGAEPAGLGARDTLRLEMGMPLYGHELSDKRNAAQSGYKRAISHTKEFVGATAVAGDKCEHMLAGMIMEGRRAARQVGRNPHRAHAGGRPRQRARLPRHGSGARQGWRHYGGSRQAHR